MAIFVVLWSCLLTTKLRCLQKNNFGHTKELPHVCVMSLPGSSPSSFAVLFFKKKSSTTKETFSPASTAARDWRQWASLGCLRCLQCAALHFRRLTALPVQAVPIQPHSVSFLAKLSSFSLIQFPKLPVICQKFSVGPQDSLTFIHQGAFKNCVDKNRDRQGW